MEKKEKEEVDLFLKKIDELEKKKDIEIFYRGESKENLLGIFKFDLDDYQITNFAEKLFFYGNKSIYFINKKYDDFKIDDISQNIFEFIFDEFEKIKDDKSPSIKSFRKENKELFSCYFEETKKDNFLEKVLDQTEENILLTRNYLLSIIHQIGHTKYKKSSHFLSTSSYEEVAEIYSKGIIIKFWKTKFENKDYSGPFLFNSFVYPAEFEYSVFSAIFPHYIISFKFEGVEYFNPYIQSSLDAEMSILFGFDINQKDFKIKLYKETKFEKGIEKNEDGKSREI